jgi:hypothetical protein
LLTLAFICGCGSDAGSNANGAAASGASASAGPAELYVKLSALSEQVMVERREKSKLESYIVQIQKEVEEKAPIIQNQV